MQKNNKVKIVLILAPLAIFIICPGNSLSQPCPEDCQCMSKEKADMMFGEENYNLCVSDPCGKEQSALNDAIVLRYCINSSCPQGSFCMNQDDAKRINYEPCSNKLTTCGFDSTNTPKYCFSPPFNCPPGCLCLTELEAEVFGFSDLCQNQSMECGHFGEIRYCFKVPKYACPTGCICLSQNESLAKNLTKMCYDQAKIPILCEIVDAEKGLVNFCFKQSNMANNTLNASIAGI